uniref:Uncharacterized protein n=1 Tax=Panagrolaimus sp. JU765 TaxID=591449 RepID=A0AC34QRM1_9BILA
MEDCQLLRARRKCPFQVSWNGNQQCFHKHLDSLQNALGKGKVVWKRNEKPVETQFELKLVPYSEDLVWQFDEVSYCESIAFVHIFFVYVSSVDEYRSQIRHRISEWFGQLNKAQNLHWLIVFDSTKAREKKNRGSVLEKLKSDFAKYQDKLVEVCDGNSSATADFSQKVLQTFLASLDRFLANYEKSFAEMKGLWENDDWNLTSFVNQQFNLCRFFWNLSLYDTVSAELDKIDSLINEIIRNCGDNCPKWLRNLSDQSFGETCPLMRLMTHVEGVPENVSLAEFRTFLLANQILSYIFVYNSRKLKTALPSLMGRSETHQTLLTNDFANILLKCVSCSIQSLKIEVYELKMKHEDVQLRVWTSLVITDVIELIDQLFLPLNELNQEQNIVCHLINLKCNSIYEIFKCSESHQKKIVAAWLKSTVAQRNADVLGIKTAELLNVFRRTFLERSELEGSPDQGKTISEMTESVLINGIQIMQTFGWKKSSSALLHSLFVIYRETKDNLNLKLSLMKLLRSLFESCPLIDLLVYYCEMALEMIPDDLKRDKPMYFNVLFLLAQNSESSEKRVKYGQLLFSESANSQEIVKKYNFNYEIPAKFPILIRKVSETFIFSLLHSTVFFKSTLENLFDFPLKNCHVKIVFKKLSKNSTEPMNPLFFSQLTDQNVSRCAAKFRGLLLKDDYKDVMLKAVHEDEKNSQVIFETKCDLQPGTNELELTTFAGIIGSFALNHVEIRCEHLDFILCFQQSIADSPNVENVYLSIDSRKPSVSLGKKPEILLAGISQMITLNVTAGTEAISEESKLTVSYSGEPKSLMEFLGPNSWDDELISTIKPLDSHETTSIDVFLLMIVDGMHFSAEKSVLTVKQLQVEWRGQKWFIELEFLPIMTMKMSTTILENKVLFAVDLSRTDSFDFLELMLTEAELIYQEKDLKNSVVAKRLNPNLTKITAFSSQKIVWQLLHAESDRLASLNHLLRIKYKAVGQPHESSQCLLPHCAFSRDYKIEWNQEFVIGHTEYEINSQIAASENIALCRVHQECNLIVSLTALSGHSDSKIVATIDADPNHWTVLNNYSVVQMKKDCGVASFIVVPQQIGLLPYPSVYIHRCNPDYNDKDTNTDATILGERLNSYHRSQGKQMRVISTRHVGDDNISTGNASTTGSLKFTIKKVFKNVASRMDRDKD